MDQPQITPDLAGKVLTAEVRNVIKTVGDGGTLPAAHRKQMSAIALTPASAAQQRAVALLGRFCGGQDITPGQWEEIRAAHPNFADHPMPPSVSEVAESDKPGADPADAHPPAQRVIKLTKEEAAKYCDLYKKGWRQLRRWIEKGERAGDPCPLHDPRALMNWWPRHNKWRVPPEIEEAALAVAVAGPAALAQAPPPEQPAPDNAATRTTSGPMLGKAVDLESFDPEEGDRLRELKQIQAAKFAQLKEALKSGEDCALLESKYLKLSETIDKIETRVTARLQKRGLYVSRADIERDLAAAAELLRQFKDSMVRRVMELCPSLTESQRSEVAAAIDRARASEEKILSRLESLTANDLLRELAA